MILATTCLLLGNLAAVPQGVVVPAEFAHQPGNSADQAPFGRDRHRHVQYVHRSLLAAVPAGQVLTGIAYRRHGNESLPVMRRERAGEVRQRPAWLVRMGNVVVDVADPSPAYPAATDPAWRVVVAPRPFDFPELPREAVRLGPAPFALVFPFDVPFAYHGGELGIEHIVDHRKEVVYDYVVDAVEARGEPGQALAANLGGGLRLTAAPGAPGGVLGVGLHAAPPCTPVVLALGPVLLPLCTGPDGSLHAEVGLPASALWNQRVLELSCRVGEAQMPVLRVRCGAVVAPAARKMAVVAGFPEPQVEHGFVQRGRGLVFELR